MCQGCHSWQPNKEVRSPNAAVPSWPSQTTRHIHALVPALVTLHVNMHCTQTLHLLDCQTRPQRPVHCRPHPVPLHCIACHCRQTQAGLQQYPTLPFFQSTPPTKRKGIGCSTPTACHRTELDGVTCSCGHQPGKHEACFVCTKCPAATLLLSTCQTWAELLQTNACVPACGTTAQDCNVAAPAAPAGNCPGTTCCCCRHHALPARMWLDRSACGVRS